MDFSTFTPKRRSDWWTKRHGPPELFKTAEQQSQRRHLLHSAWRVFVRRGLSRPFLGILLRFEPKEVVLRNVVASRGMAVPERRQSRRTLDATADKEARTTRGTVLIM